VLNLSLQERLAGNPWSGFISTASGQKVESSRNTFLLSHQNVPGEPGCWGKLCVIIGSWIYEMCLGKKSG
jgi:hypothetical protein